MRGRRPVSNIGAAKFELGDLILSIAPVGRSGHSSGALARVREFADAIGLGFESAEAYRRTAHAWPPETRRPDVPWGVHRRLVPSPDRVELLDELLARKGGRVTVADAAEVGARPMPGLTVAKIEARITTLARDLDRMDTGEPADLKAIALRLTDVALALSVRADEARSRPQEAVG